MRVLLIIVLLITTTGFTSCGKRETIRVPGPVEYRDRLVVQPVPPDLLREHPIAVGDIAECPRVASQRRAEIEACNADKRAVRDLQQENQ
jgi:hypothetical protein